MLKHDEPSLADRPQAIPELAPPVEPASAAPPVAPAPLVAPTLTATAPIQPAQDEAARAARKRLDLAVIGAILIMVGAITLLADLWRSDIIGLLVLPALGVAFLAWGFIERRPGFMIPGAILTGLGLGTLAQQTMFVNATGDARGGIVTLGLALGFLAIMPLIWMAGGAAHWWPVIPGGILLAVSLALLSGPNGLTVLQALGNLWPVAPIVVGLYLLWLVFRPSGRGRDRPRHER